MFNNAERIPAVFLAAVELEGAAERAAFLDRACNGDAALRARVEALLRAHDGHDSLLDQTLFATDNPISATASTLAYTTSDVDADEVPLAFLEPTERPDSLGRIGHYEMLQVLGKGGFGIVFRAFDDVLHRVVGVKVLSPELAATSPARKRFLREARSSAQVRHENVVQVYEVGEQPLPYIAMEFIPGETLQQRLDRTGPLDVPDLLKIGRQIAEGLAAAHAQGLIHRDIKPGNILIESSPNQHVKITDFGLARAADDASISQSGIIAGTPMYMAPEQAQGDKIDHRADLFSLGSVLYTMASGRPPFRANGTLAVLKRVTEDTPRPIPEIIPEVPQWICDLISRLHAKNPEHRLSSAREVADLLGQGLAAIQQPGNIMSPPVIAPVALREGEAHAATMKLPEPAPTPKPRPPFQRWAAVATMFLLLFGGLGYTEATGVTDVRGTVIRLFSPEGTLVIEVDDPGVSVKIDGADLVIKGAGAQEIRLRPGSYTVKGLKDGKVVSQELVTVAKNGKQVVRVSHEGVPSDGTANAAVGSLNPTQAAARAANAARWETSVSGLPAVEQAKAVALRLQELNPGFDGTITPTIEHAVVKKLELNIDYVTDISPIRAFTELDTLVCKGSDAFEGQFVNDVRATGYEEGRVSIRSVGTSRLVDLSPVSRLPIKNLSFVNCHIFDLTPLKGMKLKTLDVSSTKVHDLSPLKGMPLESLHFSFTKVSDISPLKGMKLTSVGFESTDVADLTPLKGMALTSLALGRNSTDLTPLTGMPLELLTCCDTKVSDISPLKGMPLKLVNLGGTRVSDVSPLRRAQLVDCNLGGTPVSDITPLRGLRLNNLAVNNTNVSDLTPLKGMPPGTTANSGLEGHRFVPCERYAPDVACRRLQSQPRFEVAPSDLNAENH